MSRRGLLVGGGAALAAAGAVGIEQGALPGRSWVRYNLALDAHAPEPPPARQVRIERGSFVSRYRPGVETHWVVVGPPDARTEIPIVVALHGLHQQAETVIGRSLYVDRYLAAVVADGTAPFAVAAVDGGTSYWHPRPDGEDTGAMVASEFLPMLADRGYPISRIGLLGWSMGGYGALRLAGLLGPDRVGAVVASSPALWQDGGDASSSGFADAAECEKFSVLGHQDDLAGIRVRVDVGTGDPFHPAVQDYVESFPDDARVVSTFGSGGHDTAYWRRMLPAQLRFLGRGVGSPA